MAAAFGMPDDFLVTSKFGRHIGIDLGNTEDIWTVGGTRAWLTGAQSLEILGGAQDSAAGSGARKVLVSGLNDIWDFATVEMTMDGANPVAIPGLWQRINRMFVSESGTYTGNNDGIVICRISGNGAIQSNILAGVGQTEQTHYSIARNHTGVLSAVYISTDATKSVDASLYQNSGIDDQTGPPFTGAKRKIWGITGLKGAGGEDHVTHGLLIGPCDIWWRATSPANGTEVEAGFDCLVRNLLA
jgi:hypothetical protein